MTTAELHVAWGAAMVTALGRSIGTLVGVVLESNEAPLAILAGRGDAHLFVAGGVAESQDGEWRPIVVSWEALCARWSGEGYAEIRAKVEPVVLSYFSEEAGPLRLAGNPEEARLLERAGAIPLGAQLVAAAAGALARCRSIHPSQSESTRLCVELGADVLKVLTGEEQDELARLFSRENASLMFRSRADAVSLPAGGVKLRPMSLAEISHPGNPKFPAWREWMVDQLVSEMVVNRVAYQLPYAAPQIFFVEGTGSDFYANHAQHERYARAQSVVEVRLLIEEARRQTKLRALSEDAVAALDTHLIRALRYVDVALVMTDVSMLKFSAYMGRPLTLYAEQLRAKAFGADSERGATFRDAQLYEVLWVDWLYGLYVLHRRAGVVHMDLHAGNAIVSHSIIAAPRTDLVVPGGAFTLRREAGVPVGGIIDFSRAVAFPAAAVAAQLLPEQLAEYRETQQTLLNQGVERALGLFAETHPAMVHNARIAAQAAQPYPALLFRAASALDVAMLAHGALSIDGVNASKEYRALASRLEVGALALFAALLGDAVIEEHGAAPFDALPPAEWPALQLLHANFAHLRDIPPQANPRPEIWRADAPLSRDQREPAQFASAVRAVWKALHATRPVPAIFAERDESSRAKAEPYVELYNARVLALQQQAAMHRKTTSAQSTGSWVL